MIFPDRATQARLVRGMAEAHQRVETLRRAALRGLPYRWEDVDALLAMGDRFPQPSRMTSGAASLQKAFLKSRAGEQAP
jgi:hypothetical protein